jgi:hypothetical protein
MRINVYSQELTSDVEMVVKTGTNDVGEVEQFLGVRMFLLSPEQLHHTPNDDDRSAITFWLPKSRHRRDELARTFRDLAFFIDGGFEDSETEYEPWGHLKDGGGYVFDYSDEQLTNPKATANEAEGELQLYRRRSTSNSQDEKS